MSAAGRGPGLFDLSGKIAVVTGGNGGIGLGMARGLAEAGADIAIWARNAEKNATAVETLRGLGVEAIALQCDVAREDDVAESLAETLESLGRVDIAIANAAIAKAGDPLEMTLEDWRRLAPVNVDGVFTVFRDCAKHMIERGGGGKLIAISSISEIFGAPLQPHYASGKGALGALVRSMAVRLARHDIQVNSVQPGWIHTDATLPLKKRESAYEVVRKRTPARRWGEPDDLAGIGVYLSSDASRYHTGDTIRVDGGYSVY